GSEVRLSPREFDLLVYLSSQPGRVYSRQEIEINVWGEELPPASNVVDVHSANIRGKLRDAGGFGAIRTVRGIGYAVKSCTPPSGASTALAAGAARRHRHGAPECHRAREQLPGRARQPPRRPARQPAGGCP